MSSRILRTATPADGEACATIYEPYVRETSITFEIDPPDAQEMSRRIAKALQTHSWLVLEENGIIIGYAYGSQFAPRAAYRWTCEGSVYVDRQRRRSGAGRALYEALIDALAKKGYRRMIALIAPPNPASVKLHQALGFTPIGTAHNVGWKNGSWLDVQWLELNLTPDEDLSLPPTEVAHD